MYITEISLTDFRKLGLVGYKQTRVDDPERGTHRFEMLPVDEIIPESEAEYARTFEHKTVAVFFNENPEDVAWDKYYCPTPATFTTWAGVEHIYSRKCSWLVKADSEDGAISKRMFSKIYVVHVED